MRTGRWVDERCAPACVQCQRAEVGGMHRQRTQNASTDPPVAFSTSAQGQRHLSSSRHPCEMSGLPVLADRQAASTDWPSLRARYGDTGVDGLRDLGSEHRRGKGFVHACTLLTVVPEATPPRPQEWGPPLFTAAPRGRSAALSADDPLRTLCISACDRAFVRASERAIDRPSLLHRASCALDGAVTTAL